MAERRSRRPGGWDGGNEAEHSAPQSICANCGQAASRRHRVRGSFICDAVGITNTAVPALLPAPGAQTHSFVRRASGLIQVAESDAQKMAWCASIRDDADRLAELLATEQAARFAQAAHQVAASLSVQSAVSRGTADVLKFADERVGIGVFVHELATLLVSGGFIGGAR